LTVARPLPTVLPLSSGLQRYSSVMSDVDGPFMAAAQAAAAEVGGGGRGMPRLSTTLLSSPEFPSRSAGLRPYAVGAATAAGAGAASGGGGGFDATSVPGVEIPGLDDLFGGGSVSGGPSGASTPRSALGSMMSADDRGFAPPLSFLDLAIGGGGMMQPLEL
jgi:hypothetical protein